MAKAITTSKKREKNAKPFETSSVILKLKFFLKPPNNPLPLFVYRTDADIREAKT